MDSVLSSFRQPILCTNANRVNNSLNLDYNFDNFKYSENDPIRAYKASYRIDGDNVVITDYNEEFLKSEHLTGDNLKGKVIDNHKCFESLSKQLKYLNKRYDKHTLNFIREKQGLLWNITLSIDYPYIESEGRLMTSVCNEESLDIMSCSFIKKMPISSILADKENDKYVIKSFSENLLDYVTFSIGDDLESTFNDKLTMLKTSLILTKCLEENRSYCFLDELSIENKTVYFLCIINPICHLNQTSVLLNLYDLNVEQYLELHKRNAFFEQYFISLNVGVAFFQSDSNAIIRSDKVFDDFYNKNKKYIDLNKPLYKCQQEKNIIFEEISISDYPNDENDFNFSIKQDRKFSFAFIPLADSLLTMIITAPKNVVDKELQLLYQHLSNRETEIVDFVLQGYKNSYIAHVLGIAEGTVKKTLTNSFAKMGVSSRMELIKKLYK